MSRRNHVFVRPVRPEEAAQYWQWAIATDNNLFDPDVLTYPSTKSMCAFDKDGAVVYVPIQRPLMLESLAIRPGADPIAVAAALKALTQAAVTQAYQDGVGEIYFLCKDASTIEFAERQAYEEVPFRLFRIKLKNLEPTEEPKE